MQHYLLSVITPTDGQMPSPDEMAEIVRKLGIFHDELQAAGAWVFMRRTARAGDGDRAAPQGR